MPWHISFIKLPSPTQVTMDIDSRSRTWLVTIPWVDATTPTESVIPNLSFKLAHAKYSRVNDSVSIWFTFVNQVRASTVTQGFDVDHVVIKRVTPSESLQQFQDLPHDWELVKTKRDEPLTSELTPQHRSAQGRKRPVPSNPDGVDHPSDDEFDELISKLRKARKCQRCERIRSILK